MTSDDFRRFLAPLPSMSYNFWDHFGPLTCPKIERSLKRAHRMTLLEGLCCCPLLLLLLTETLQVVLLFQEQTTDIHYMKLRVVRLNLYLLRNKSKDIYTTYLDYIIAGFRVCVITLN